MHSQWNIQTPAWVKRPPYRVHLLLACSSRAPQSTRHTGCGKSASGHGKRSWSSILKTEYNSDIASYSISTSVSYIFAPISFSHHHKLVWSNFCIITHWRLDSKSLKLIMYRLHIISLIYKKKRPQTSTLVFHLPQIYLPCSSSWTVVDQSQQRCRW